MSDEDIDRSYGEGEEGFDEDDEGSDFDDVFDEDAHELDDGDDSLRDSSSTVELRERNRAKEVRSVLTSSGIVRAREEKLQRVMDVLILPEHLAEALLNGFSWNDGDLIERFSDSPESCFKKAGLDPKSLSTANNQTTLTNSADGGKGKEITCTICFDDVTDYATIPCGHVFCKDCWRSL
jgi:hypothetical protein